MNREEHRERIESMMRAAHDLNRKENVKLTQDMSNEIIFDVLIEEIAVIRARLDEQSEGIKKAYDHASWAKHCAANP